MTCAPETLTDHFTAVTLAITTVQDFVDIKEAAERIVDIVPRMIALVEAVVVAAEALPDKTFLIDIITKGPLSKITNLIDAFTATKDLPKLANDLQRTATGILDFVTKYTKDGAHCAAVLEEVLASAWESYPLEFTTDSTGNVRAGVVAIQALVRDELAKPLRNVTDSINALDKSLDLIPVKKGSFSLASGVSSYRRFSSISMDVPCTRTKKQTFSDPSGKFKQTVSYPEFYACKYGPKKIPWPNHHIPYIKFRVT